MTDQKSVNRKYRLWAEAINVDEQPSNDVYMQIQMKMMSTAPNGNGCVVERDFMEAVVDNQDFYVGTPVKVDIDALVSDEKLGHKFDKDKQEWMADQIGSITSFSLKDEEDEETGDTVTVLYGDARVEKGRADVCEAIQDLYDAGKLFFSFEIIAQETTEDPETGYVHIGAGEHNHLTAMCVVSVPAYKGAVATTFVAEKENEMDQNEKQFKELINWASELEIDAVHWKLYDILFDCQGEYCLDWGWDIREQGADYVLLKNRREGTYKKAMFHVENDEVIVDELFDVELTRKADTIEAEAENETEAEDTVEPTANETVENVEPVEPTETVEAESETAEAETDEPETVEETEPVEAEVEDAECKKNKADDEDAECKKHNASLDIDVDAMMTELEQLRAFKAEKMEEARVAKVSKLRVVAELLGLDTDAMKDDIEALDFEKVMASVELPDEVDNSANNVNPTVENGEIEIRASRWDGYVTDPTGLGE